MRASSTNPFTLVGLVMICVALGAGWMILGPSMERLPAMILYATP